MKHDPVTRQRSEWALTEDDLSPALGAPTRCFKRRVHDGLLMAFVSDEPQGLHLSISHRDHRGEPRRYPTWDEIMHARQILLPEDVGFVMHLPVEGEYVALHPTTFHLHEWPER